MPEGQPSGFPSPPLQRGGGAGHVAVVGGGFGGLAAALELASAGVDVTLFEAAEQVGGKARRLPVGGRQVDAGPTVFTMRWVFDALFEGAGVALDDAVALEQAQVLARHAWPDGSRFDLFTDLDQTVAAVAALAGPAEAERYRRFAAETAAAYDLFRPVFIEAPRPTPLDVLLKVGLRGLPRLLAARPAANLYRAISDLLTDPRLRQLFGRYATYCGSNPFAAPATLMLIAHVERMGVWRVPGGMQSLAQAMAEAFERCGGQIRLAAPIAAIEAPDGRIKGLRLASGERVAAEAVVFNGDAGALATGLLGPEVARAVPSVPRRRRSYSAMVWSVAAEARGFPLSHHTVFFGPDYAREFDDMGQGRLPRDPTTYICALDRGAGPETPEAPGIERFHVQVNAPAVGDDPTALGPREIETCRQQTEALMQTAGLSLSLAPETSTLTTPAGFHRLFPGTGGALYGEATHGPFASFRRAATQTRIAGLYLAGGSAHPGAGVPMAALSGRLAAAAVRQALASTRRSSRGAISGGISTPSATTGSTG
ncbi:MAG: 1-hydroxycarotenoid 3,4-desaturase CrtD [Pseudomonadota bacterium]